MAKQSDPWNRDGYDELSDSWQRFRASPVFPLGAVAAGVIAGALVAGLFGRRKSSRSQPAMVSDTEGNLNPARIVYMPAPKPNQIFGFAPRDLIELISVGAVLATQFRNWRAEEQAKDNLPPPIGTNVPPPAGASTPPPPPPPAETKKK